MKKDVIINETIYQEFKKSIYKKDDYFSIEEWEKLMQFLMQCQRKL